MDELHDYANWMLGQRLAPRTIEQRVEFADWRLREWRTWDLPGHVIAGWLSQHDGWTAVTYYGHLRSVYAWLLEAGHITKSPMDPIRRPKPPPPRPKPLTPSEVVAVLDGASGHLRSWMLLALLAGLRVHEIAKLRGQDIDETEIYVIGKGGKPEVLPTHPDLWELAQTYPRHGLWFPSPVRRGEPYTADHISGQVADRFRSVGIARGSIHRLRATYGTNLLRNGANLRVVQTLMRHSSLATTEHYLGVDEVERTEAIRRLSA
ncbi:tyrosine-type recombinase/integrase [Nocardioides massiliensis]|uniref:Integrase/recombinase XerD n=1 Tax=Nocardioides massiliensis TaxID=1325935 RepID=A0ABT9NQS7_9ACTN|nr:site-specific integrase [Nocardioides massiliensis]MDP9822786.1 integrase/recombinase XerD [Nocardioides massiliensis]